MARFWLVCFLVNGEILHYLIYSSILQIEVPANYSLFHPPIENGKTMEVKLAWLYEGLVIFTFLMYIRVAQVVVNWSVADEDFFFNIWGIFFVSTAEDWGLRSSLLNSFSFVFLAIIFVAGRVKLFCSKKPWLPTLWRECHENKTYAFKDKTLRKFAYVWGQTTTCATLMQIYCNWCLQPGIYWYHLR